MPLEYDIHLRRRIVVARVRRPQLRERLVAIFAEWRVPFAACIHEAQASGEIAADFPPDELADFLLASWQGAILRMKVERNPAPLERFKTIAFQTVFREPS